LRLVKQLSVQLAGNPLKKSSPRQFNRRTDMQIQETFRNGTSVLAWLGWVSLLAMIFCASDSAVAQVLFGSLIGNVVDHQGASIPTAQVHVLNQTTGTSRETETNSSGMFSISDLSEGIYRIIVTKESFDILVINDVVVLTNQTRRADAQLKVASVNAVITVEAFATGLQGDRTEVNHQLTGQQIDNLPTSISRNFESLFRTIPGTSPPSASHSGASNPQLSVTFNINGGTNTSNSTVIDGASDEYPWLPEIAAYVPPQDAIASVSVVTNSFDAELGFGASSVTNVTLKSGDNHLHGAAWEYNTISNLQAKNYFYVGSRNPKYILNQFGADLGVPIVREKLFFFGDYERTSQRNLLTGFATVPTAAEIAGDFSNTSTIIYDPSTGTPTGTGRSGFTDNVIPGNKFSTAASTLLALLPTPNVPGATTNNYFASGDYALTRQNADIKISYIPRSDSSIFGSYSISPSTIFDGQELGAAGGPTIDGGQPGNAIGRVQRFVTGGAYSFNSRLLIDGNFAFTRINYQAINTDIGTAYGETVLGIPGTNSGAQGSTLENGIPNFALSGFTSLGNTNNSNPFHFRDNIWVEAANLTWIRDRHNVRLGGQASHYQIANFQANTTYGVRGGFTFSGGLTSLNGGPSPNMYNSLADLELGLPQTLGEDHQYFNPSVVRQDVVGFYARDQWQPTGSLTITYGLRYEVYPYSRSDHFGGVRYDPGSNLVYIGGTNGIAENAGVHTGHGQVAPRLGVAYRIGKKTVVRTGFGMNTNSEFFRYNVQVYPAIISAQYSGENSYSAAGSLLAGIPAFSGPAVATGTLALPSTFGTTTYPATYRRGYTQNANVFVERTLGFGFITDAGFVHSHGFRIDSYLNINAAAPGTGKLGQPIYEAFGNASSIYSVIPFLSSDYNGLQVEVRRRVGADGNLGANYTYSKTMDDADSGSESSLIFNYASALGRNYARAGFDRPHNFEIFGTVSSPFGTNKKHLSNAFVTAFAEGWRLNAILSRSSGVPFTVTASGTSLNAPGNTQVANQVTAHVKIIGGHGTNIPYFDPAAFAPVSTPTFGTSARDSVRGPGYFDLDASLFRDFPLDQRFVFQIRAEAFGLTNTPQFANPAANVSNAVFTNGTISNLNGYDTITSSTGQRQLRFAAKLNF
jgi:hypothetical protein